MSDAANGLTSADAAQRLVEHGPNEPVRGERLSALRHLLRQFENPLVVILLIASAISATLGQRTDAAIIVAIVLVSMTIDAVESWRSQNTATRLRASVTPTATVKRDGTWREVPLREVVPGDVFRLSAGDLVPADARLLDSRDLSVQQSMLTGESLPADKHASAAKGATGGPNDPGLVFSGTSVVSGTATAVALTTGPETLFGDVARRLSARPPASEFDDALRRFSLLILRTTIVLVLFILVVSVAMRRDAVESLLFAVALGVGLTPEFLPMIQSVTLAAGAIRMARDGVIVKQLAAIQNFGSIDVLCSDKTGTLTRGDMEVEESVDAAGAISERPLVLAWVNSHLQTGIRSPLDTAILARPHGDAEQYRKVDEIPFDFERRRLSIVATAPDGRMLLITKGAPEPILALTVAVDQAGAATPIDDAVRRGIVDMYQRFGDAGFRVLAVAYRVVDSRSAYSTADEHDFVLAGLLAFADPVLPDAGAAIDDLRGDGVGVKILTGDNDRVARHVCSEVHVDGDIVSGDDLVRLDDPALGHVAEQATMFARVSPAQKDRVILALKRRGHVVGFMGDGINDAPSLHVADVGVSVMAAADVARDAAGVILSRPGLRVLHQAILEGRRGSGNMLKYLLMGTSSNFGNMFSMAAASVFLPFLPMTPTQILLNNLMYDLAQIAIPTDTVDRAYLRTPKRWDMKLVRTFMVTIGPISSIFDFLTFYVMLRVLHADQTLFHTGWFVESLATQTLVLFVIRTTDNPLVSRPSTPLTVSILAIVAIGLALPFLPVAPWLGFTPLPGAYFVFLAVTVVAYLMLVQAAKQRILRHVTV